MGNSFRYSWVFSFVLPAFHKPLISVLSCSFQSWPVNNLNCLVGGRETLIHMKSLFKRAEWRCSILLFLNILLRHILHHFQWTPYLHPIWNTLLLLLDWNSTCQKKKEKKMPKPLLKRRIRFGHENMTQHLSSLVCR